MSARPTLTLQRPAPPSAPTQKSPTPAVPTNTPDPEAPSEAKWREAWTARSERLRSRFWVVWCPTELRPQRRQESREAALAEAKRLHALFLAKEFLTYGCALIVNGGEADVAYAAAQGFEVRPKKKRAA
jgi:hypothetical protein